MDLPLHLKVIWRFKFLVAAGFVLAVGLAFLSVFKVSSTGLTYRSEQVWADDVTLLVSPQRFPWGGTNLSNADPATFGQLATIYANLATSDAVKKIVLKKGYVDFAKEPMLATVVPYSYQSSNSPPLPFITLEAQAATKPRVMELVKREADAFLFYLRRLQAEGSIPKEQRAQISIVKGDQIRLLKPRSKTVPIMIFMLVMIATIGLSFMLENLRPRARLVAADEVVLARRSA
ncbi:MAG TPA: hypothetical protein VGJ77_00905 [Gaiellaceae bacterium]